jgi:GMP synthase-like glutamine amidotransferase
MGVPVRPVLAITHLARYTKIGLAGTEVRGRGLGVLALDLFDHGDLPALEDVAAIMSFGGQMSVTALDDYPFLMWELELMERALAEEVPVLGMCLGAQLLARAAGGDVVTMDRPYVGWPELRLRPEARDDPIFGVLPDRLPVLKWHNDAIIPPGPDSVLAETGSPGCAILRAGPNAWGSQMHLETTPDILFDEWLPDPAEVAALRRSGGEPAAFERDARARLPQQMDAARPVFARFAELVAEREGG